MSGPTSPHLAHPAPSALITPAAAAKAKRTLECTAHGLAPKAKRPRNKAALPSNFYKECNKIYARIEASKYDTKEIIKRLVRKSKIDKSELERPRVHNSSAYPRVPESSIVSTAVASVPQQQNVPLKTSDLTLRDITLETTSSIGGCLTESNGDNDLQMKTLLSSCLSSMKALADLNKHLLAQKSSTSTPGPSVFAKQKDALEFDDDLWDIRQNLHSTQY